MLDLGAIKERRAVSPPEMFGGVYFTPTCTVDLDALIEEVERLQSFGRQKGVLIDRLKAERDEARAERDRWKKEAAWAQSEYDKCRTELERLRTAIAGILVPDND